MTDKTFRLLGLFSIERPVWTAEQIAATLSVGISTVYRILSKLSEAGLVDAVAPGRYVLGPAIIQMDRQIQLTDPLVQAAQRVMRDLIVLAPEGSSILLCRAFRDEVLCIHQVNGSVPMGPVSYQRGQPQPLFWGATSRSILAFLPLRTLKRLYADHGAEIQRASLGNCWAEFLETLRLIRRGGVVLAHSEVDPGKFGVAAPVLGGDRNAIGSLSYVLDAAPIDERMVNRLSSMIRMGAREVEQAMAETAARPASIASSTLSGRAAQLTGTVALAPP